PLPGQAAPLPRYRSADQCRPRTGLARRAVVGRGRDVQGGVAVEETGRLEHEAAAGDRHDGPVLRARNMGGAERVPQHDVGAVDALVTGDEGGKAGSPGVLVDEVAGRPAV